jgi:hypothetical protein
VHDASVCMYFSTLYIAHLSLIFFLKEVFDDVRKITFKTSAVEFSTVKKKLFNNSLVEELLLIMMMVKHKKRFLSALLKCGVN